MDDRYYALAENFTPAGYISGGTGQGTSGNGGNTYIPNMTNDMSGYMNNLAGVVNNIFGGLSAEYAQGLFLSGGKGQINSTGNSSTNGLGGGGSQVLYAQVGGEQSHDKPGNIWSNPYLRAFHKQELGHVDKELEMSLVNFRDQYAGMTLNALLNENKQSGYNAGISKRYIEDPLYKGIYIDMKHFLNATVYSSFLGMLKEKQQAIKGNDSAHNPQDYYSNNLGEAFKRYQYSLYGQYGYLHNKNVAIDIYIFLNSIKLRGGK